MHEKQHQYDNYDNSNTPAAKILHTLMQFRLFGGPASVGPQREWGRVLLYQRDTAATVPSRLVVVAHEVDAVLWVRPERGVHHEHL